MPKRTKSPQYQCEFFTWKLFNRDGVIYADGRIRGQRLGKHSLETRDLDEALKNLKRLDWRKAIERGLAIPQADKSEIELTVQAGWDKYLEHRERPGFLRGLSPNSLRRYRQARNKHLQFCVAQSVRTWTDINEEHVLRFGQWLHRRHHADRGAYLLMVVLQAAHRWLIKAKHLPAAARFSLDLDRPEGTETYCFTREQVAAMVKHCQATESLKWLEQVIIVLSCSGLRISEVAGLRQSDVDLEARTIILTDERASGRRIKLGTARRIKGKRTRRIPICPQLHQLLSQLPTHADGRLLHDHENRPLLERRVREALVRHVIRPLVSRFPTPPGEIGFEHGRVHSFRHFFVSECFRQGATESEIMSWTGHSDPKLVALYRHLRHEDSVDRMSRIAFIVDQE